MDYAKQLIKAINDLTKSVDRNTKALIESKQEIVSENSNESILLTPDELNRLINKKASFVNNGIYSGSWGNGLSDNKEIEPMQIIPKENDPYIDVINKMNEASKGIVSNDSDNAYKKGVGGIIKGGNLPIGHKPWDGTISGEQVLTKEMINKIAFKDDKNRSL